MKATQLIGVLQQLIARHGDGSVGLAACETIPDIRSVTVTTELETNEPVFVLWPEGPMLVEAWEEPAWFRRAKHSMAIK